MRIRRVFHGSRTRRHAAAMVSVGVVAALALSACGSGGSSNTTSTATGGSASSGAATSSSGSGGGSGIPAATLNVIAADYGNGPSAANSGQKWWDGVVADFNKKYPQITVKVNVINWNDVDAQIKKQVAAGNPPDIAQASADWTGLTDQVYPADQVLSKTTQNNILSSFSQQGEIDGTQYGIPWISSSRALFYNKDLFSKAGISAPPKTWAEFKTDAQKLKQAGADVPACIPFGSEEAQAETLIWELGNGGGFVDSSGNWTLDSPANIETFTYLQGLVSAGLTEPNPATVDRTKGCWAAFKAGKVGEMHGQPALLPQLKGSGVNFGIAPIPGKNGPAKSTLGVCDWIWAFKGDGDHQQQIKAFLDFVMQDKYQESFFNEYELLPITKGASKQLASKPHLKPFLDALPNATFYPTSKKTWTQVNEQMKQIVGQALQPGNAKTVLGQLQNTAQG